MPAPVVLILAAGRGERFLASGGNTHKCIGWRQSPETGELSTLRLNRRLRLMICV